MLIHSPEVISGNANRKYGSNRKRPLNNIDTCLRIIGLCLSGNYIMRNVR